MKLLKIAAGILVAIILIVFSLARIAFEIIGASTAPDDFALLRERMPRVLEWLFTTPWIVPTAIIVLLSGGAAWLLWSGLRGAALTPPPEEAVHPIATATPVPASPEPIKRAVTIERRDFPDWNLREDNTGHKWRTLP